ncbi:hypothetical protein ACFU3O_35540 [Streptomyces antibioticus]|uniref:hypothetical protein n=1 Tax=Streptomyces antibioticus TaxID=1890 RepID=UPI003697AEB3
MPDDTQQAHPAAPSPAAGDAPPEHRMHLLGRYYRQVEAGRKTIEVRAATPNKRAISVGDTVVFHDRDTGREIDVVVQRLTPYPSFEDLLGSEDIAAIDPDGPPGELPSNLRGIYPPAKEALGVLALAFDHRPARPGRPMPMTAEEYAQTVPHHTVYGCLYIRDEHDRPIQLRSVYGSRLWQFRCRLSGHGRADRRTGGDTTHRKFKKNAPAWYEERHELQRKAHSSRHIPVEHGIAHLKNWRALTRLPRPSRTHERHPPSRRRTPLTPADRNPVQQPSGVNSRWICGLRRGHAQTCARAR